MAGTYTTIQGETWDGIAYKVYGSESHADFLMENNYPCLDILVFSAGTVLDTPDLPDRMAGELPPWRLNAGGSEAGEDPYDDYDDEDGGVER